MSVGASALALEICALYTLPNAKLPEAGVLKKLSFAGLAKLTPIGRCTQPANSQLIPQNMMK
jgi:hypothetical protein